MKRVQRQNQRQEFVNRYVASIRIRESFPNVKTKYYWKIGAQARIDRKACQQKPCQNSIPGKRDKRDKRVCHPIRRQKSVSHNQVAKHRVTKSSGEKGCIILWQKQKQKTYNQVARGTIMQ